MDSPNKLQKYKKYKKYKKVHKYKSTHNSVIFWATDSKFCMEVHMDCPNKWESTLKSIKVKVQKYKKAKICKKWKFAKKSVKSTKSTKVQNFVILKFVLLLDV